MARNKGFTLFELLIVVAVIGILAATQMTSIAQKTRTRVNEHAGIQIANLAIGVRSKAQDPITPLAEIGYNDLRMFKFQECRPDIRDGVFINGAIENNVVINGILEDDGIAATPADGQGALDPLLYPRMTRFMGCGQRMIFPDSGVMSIGNTPLVPEVSIPDPANPANTIVLREAIPAGQDAMVLQDGVFTIRVDVGGFLNGDRENRVRQLSSLGVGFEQTMFANLLNVPDQVQLFPYTLDEIDAFLDDRTNVGEQYIEIDIPIRLGDFLRADGG
ncbi:prepilin-type N-terminal cleavage/methylation domain-containing protein, partial [Vibrio makurazakiensis]|uniref:type IV pilin protein n=1 Tax=Vibrio makurazakiensis TaxID=2910250 RepID=UPI003D102276